MNIVVSNSPDIPGGAEAGLASTGTYLLIGVNSWYMPTSSASVGQYIYSIMAQGGSCFLAMLLLLFRVILVMFLYNPGKQHGLPQL